MLGDEQQEGMLGVIAGESERLARIVNDILSPAGSTPVRRPSRSGAADAAEIARAVLAAAETHLRLASSWRSPLRRRTCTSPQTRTGCARCSSTWSRTRSSTRLTAAGSSSSWSRSKGVCASQSATGTRDPGCRARADLREVLSPRPESLARRRRHGPRPLHLPRDRAPDGRPDPGRVRSRARLDVHVRAAARSRKRPVAALGAASRFRNIRRRSTRRAGGPRPRCSGAAGRRNRPTMTSNHREDEAESPYDHQDDANRLQLETGDRGVHGPGQDRPDGDQKDAYSKTHFCSSLIGGVPSCSCPDAGVE